jgi:dTMP kinase
MLRLERYLRREGHKVVKTREPNGTALGFTIRHLFELPGFRPKPLTEVFLFMAARHHHVTERIRPWLKHGYIVLCDRYADATVAYQGYGRGVDPDLIREMNLRATEGIMPDLTLLLDLEPEEGFRRIARRLDYFEKRALAFHRRVRLGYLEIFRAEPKRVRLIPAVRPPDEIAEEIKRIVGELLRGL